MVGGRDRRGQVLNEEAPYHKYSVQDVMIEDLHRQVVQITQSLAAQNMEMHCDIDDRDSKFNFENPYHNPVMVWEQLVQDEWHGNLGFIVEVL
jgi:hypothetical protein